MSPRPLVALFAVLAMTAMDSAAALRVGELAVRSGSTGLPCFTISKAEEERAGSPNFHSITVTEGKTTMWSMAMPAQRTFPVSFRMCIPYAGRLPVLPQTPAAELQSGKVYEVVLESRQPPDASKPRSYRGRFCVVPGASGVSVFTPVSRSACTDTWRR
ncbi:MAG: hypothetical protein V4723_22250 [Pseudomonadota bacterium]